MYYIVDGKVGEAPSAKLTTIRTVVNVPYDYVEELQQVAGLDEYHALRFAASCEVIRLYDCAGCVITKMTPTATKS